MCNRDKATIASFFTCSKNEQYCVELNRLFCVFLCYILIASYLQAKVNIKKVQDILARDQDVPLPRNPYTDPSYMQNVVDHEYGLYTQLAKNAREKAGYLSGVRQFGANQGEIVDSDSKSIKGGGDAQLNPNLIKATPQH